MYGVEEGLNGDLQDFWIRDDHASIAYKVCGLSRVNYRIYRMGLEMVEVMLRLNV